MQERCNMKSKYSENKEWQDYLKLYKERPELFLQSDQISIIFDENTINTFVEKTNKKIGVLYESDFHILIVDLVSDKNKKLYTYERLLPSVNSGAVVALPIQNKKLVLLKQYRHAIRQSQYCFPRGFGEVGLSAQQNAEKELKEELHAHITKTQYLGNIIADSGILSTQTAVFVCEVEDIQKEYGYEGIEDIVFLTPKELETWISNKKITDSFTLSAYSLYKFHCK